MPKNPRPKASDTIYELLDDSGNVLGETTTAPVGVRFNVKRAGARPAHKKPHAGADAAAGARHDLTVTDEVRSSDSAG